jgi:exodeoxyribonuclease-3
MKVATWNVNSIKARKERLLAWLAHHRPDVLCLQELKLEDRAFPHAELLDAGYHAAVHGQKTYNGVAILSRVPATDVRVGLGDDVEDPQARLIRANVSGITIVSIYVPNGGELGSEKFNYKQAWLDRFDAYLKRTCDPAQPLVVCGDLNIAPDERDVARPEEWSESVLCAAEVRAAFQRIVDFGMVDCFRRHHAEAGLYSWWDYRQLGFPKNNGLRIDHILATKSAADRCTASFIDRDERKGKLPSDHAPVVAEFSDA